MASSSTSATSTSVSGGDGALRTLAFKSSRERFVKEHRQKAASQKQREFHTGNQRFENQASEDLFNWYVYAGYVNPEAGMQMKEAATFLRSAQGKYNYEGNTMPPGVPKDVLTYLLIAKASVLGRLEDEAQDCERPSPLYFKPGIAQEALCHSVDALRANLAKILEKLRKSLSSESTSSALPTGLCDWWDTINPETAYESIVDVASALEPLSVRLWRIYGKRKTEAGSPTASTGLRRRRPSDVVTAGQAQDPAANLSETWVTFVLELFDNSISRIQRINPLVSQDTLWVITFIFITVSGVISGYSIALKAETAPKMSDDPNFWSLLSQTVTQWLSLYSSILPVLRKDVERRTIWFPLCLSISAAASLVAPIIYHFTPQGASMLTYLSAATSLVVSVFLTGDIEYMASERELPRNRRAERRWRRE